MKKSHDGSSWVEVDRLEVVRTYLALYRPRGWVAKTRLKHFYSSSLAQLILLQIDSSLRLAQNSPGPSFQLQEAL
jgi:hypothetical protein